MKKIIAAISLILALVMLCSTFTACSMSIEQETSNICESDSTSEAKSESSQTTEIPDNTKVSPNQELIDVANSLANGVQARFGNESWTTYIVENQNMSFEYRLNKKRIQNLSYLNNAEGQPYFTDSFDVFVEMDNGITYYASDSTSDAVVNVFKFGYYYDEVRMEHQNFCHVKGTKREIIPTLTLARVFHTYSDKLHTVAQIAATENTTGIVSIGFVIELPANTVEKLVVEDANGLHYSIDDVDWNTAVYAGFDVKDVGVFGYILPADSSDKLIVTLSGGNYVIKQTRTPENNTILKGEGTPSDYEGKIGNNNDFYIGQRIYTDTNHDFDAFLEEAYIERNPLTGKNIKVSSAYSSYGRFDGYDSLRGSYMFSIDSPHDNNQYDVCPNRHYYLNFTLKSDSHKRVIYTATRSTSGSLECAVLLDENLMALPVPVENGKNFNGDNDENIFSLVDEQYGESILPIVAFPDGTREYNLVNIYQNWGNFPLKQLSFIQYHSPYYHLSTGLTETNCLVPWKFTISSEISNMLPDHRGMSTTPWPGTFQRTQAGTHSFLSYTDASGSQEQSNLYDQKIHSYGPTYADVEMNHLSTDGKIKISYHHIEMPQLDENRGYYTIEYEFLDDVSINNFRYNFSFYGMGSLEYPTLYEMFSYLDENNEPQIKAYDDVKAGQFIVLGNESPYIANFKLNSYDYGNTSIVIKNYGVILGGEKIDVNLGFAIRHNKNGVNLSLDLDDVTFKKGDKITLNAILTPWGSQKTDYSGTDYPADQNVRDIRENTCINPIVATANNNAEVIEHPFIPMLKTTNGTDAEFTISGGKKNTIEIPDRNSGYNVAVRIYGFKKLSVPIVYEKVDGEWVIYDISSANHLDSIGFGAYYDGYAVWYDEDGTYSYSFVLNMDEAQDRTFRIELDEDFEKWGRIEPDLSLLDKKSPFNHYLNAKSFAQSLYRGWFSRVDLTTDNGVDHVALYAHASFGESQMEKAFKNPDANVTGQYVILKYRFPLDNPEGLYSPIDIYTSTENDHAVAGDLFRLDKELLNDGKWHVVVVDLTKYNNDTIVPNDDGTYTLLHVRLDPINSPNDTSFRVDIAYFAIHDNLDEIVEFNADEGEIHLVEGEGNVTVIKTK